PAPTAAGTVATPSEQTAHAKFWVKNVVAIATDAIRRTRRRVLPSILIFGLITYIGVIPRSRLGGFKFAPPEVPAAAHFESAFRSSDTDRMQQIPRRSLLDRNRVKVTR